MANKTKVDGGYKCPKCEIFVEDAHLEGISPICPYCGSVL